MAVPASEDKADYGAASSLLGAVLSLTSSQLARERSRVRPKPQVLSRLEGCRADALRALRDLDAAGADAVSDKFATIYLTLIADEPTDRLPAGLRASTA